VYLPCTQVENYGPVPAGKHRKKFNKFPVGILLPFPASFLQDCAGSSGRNLGLGYLNKLMNIQKKK